MKIYLVRFKNFNCSDDGRNSYYEDFKFIVEAENIEQLGKIIEKNYSSAGQVESIEFIGLKR